MANNLGGDVFDVIQPESFALDWLQRLFPALFENAGGALFGQSGWQAAMEAFNGSLLTLASLYLSWNLFSGVVDAARDGRPFQDKVHMAWGPTRATMGIGLVAPIPGVGWSLVQSFVIFLAIVGSSFATNVWNHTLDALFPTSVDESIVGAEADGRRQVGRLIATPSVGTFPTLVENTLIRELCYAKVSEYASDTGEILSDEGSDKKNGPYQGMFHEAIDYAWYQMFPDAKNGTPMVSKKWPSAQPSIEDGKSDVYDRARWDYGQLCGAAQVQITAIQDKDEWESNLNGLLMKADFNVGRYEDAREAMQDLQAYEIAKARAYGNMIARLRGQTGDVSSLPTPGGPVNPASVSSSVNVVKMFADPSQEIAVEEAAQHINAVGDAYRKEIQEIAQQFQQHRFGKVLDDFVSGAKKAGWANAGTVFMTIQSVTGQAIERAQSTPQQSKIQPKLIAEEERQGIRKSVLRAIHASSYGTRGGALSGVDIQQMVDPDALISGEKNDLEKLLAHIGQRIEDLGRIDAKNPYTEMINFGHAALNTAKEIFAYAIPAYGASSLVTAFSNGVLGGIGSLGQTAAGLGITAGALIGLLGAIHAYLLPWLPYIYWIFGILGFIYAIAEALIATPLWAVTSAKLQGDELLHDGQKTGLMLLFNVALRPVLMILGLIVGFVAFMVALTFLNKTYELATEVASFGATGIVGGIFAFFLLTYLHWYILTQSMSLIFSLPKKVGQWMGVGVTDDQGEESTRQGVYGVAVGGVISQGQQAAQKGAGQVAAGTGKATQAAASGAGAAGAAAKRGMQGSTRISQNSDSGSNSSNQ